MWEYLRRTDIKEVSPAEYMGGTALEDMLGENGICMENVVAYQSVVISLDKEYENEPGALRGGFTSSERKRVNKVPLLARTFRHIPGRGNDANTNARRRFIARPDIPDDEKGAILVFDTDRSLVGVVLLNILGENATRSRHFLVEKCKQWLLLGWAKICGISGTPNPFHILRYFSWNAMTRHSFFGSKHAGYRVNALIPSSRSGVITDSTKIEYVNLKGKVKSFQGGNFIYRSILDYKRKTNNPVLLAETRPYLDTAVDLLQQFSGFILLTKTVNRVPVDQEDIMDISDLPFYRFKHAINRFDANCHFQPAMHQDSTVHSACIVSSFVTGGAIASSNIGATCGQIFLEQGPILPYAFRDAVMFCGNSFHAPLPINPLHHDNDDCPKRYSIVSFLGSK